MTTNCLDQTLPYFSVVTPSLNCAEFLARNIKSVKNQGYGTEHLEHWIIDGGSTDGTVEFLRLQKDIRWISEPDKGLSDAVNKGLIRSRGQWIAWLNADDELQPGALRTILEWSERHPDVEMFCGDEIILRYDGAQEQIIKGWPYTYDDLLSRRPGINQASTFLHRRLVERIGGLDVNIRYAMDYEWFVRATRVAKCVYIPQVLSIYHRRQGSLMDAHMADHFRTFQSVRRRYNRPANEPLGRQIFFYLATDRLRRTPWIRRAVRWIKGMFGVKPLHPY